MFPAALAFPAFNNEVMLPVIKPAAPAPVICINWRLFIIPEPFFSLQIRLNRFHRERSAL
jgi:hypothetical protein